MKVLYSIGIHMDVEWAAVSYWDREKGVLCHYNLMPVQREVNISPVRFCLAHFDELDRKGRQTIKMLDANRIEPDKCTEALTVFLELLFKEIMKDGRFRYNRQTGERNFFMYLSTSLFDNPVRRNEYEAFLKKVVPLDGLADIGEAYALSYLNAGGIYPMLVAEYTYDALRFIYIDAKTYRYGVRMDLGANELIDRIIGHYRSGNSFCDAVNEIQTHSALSWRDCLEGYVRKCLEKMADEKSDSLRLCLSTKWATGGDEFYFFDDKLSKGELRKLSEDYWEALENEFMRAARVFVDPPMVIVTGEAASFMQMFGVDVLIKGFPISKRWKDPIVWHSVSDGVALYGAVCDEEFRRDGNGFCKKS